MCPLSIVGSFNSLYNFECWIGLAIVSCSYQLWFTKNVISSFGFKVEMQKDWESKLKVLNFFLNGHKGDSQFNLPVEIIVEIRMVYVIRASSFNHIVTHTFFGAILHKYLRGMQKHDLGFLVAIVYGLKLWPWDNLNRFWSLGHVP